MSEEPRTAWQWTPRSTALAMTGALVTASWVAVGATMMLAENPASSTAAPVKATPSVATTTPATTPAPTPARPAAKPNRSHARYNPKRYKGPLSKPVLKAPVATAHPPQVSSKPPGGHRHGH